MGFLKDWSNTFSVANKGLQSRIQANAQLMIQSEEKVKQDGVLNEILQKNLNRTVVQIQNWRFGLSAWEDKRTPDRSWMHEVYQEVILDPQVAAKVGVAHNKVEASEFFFIDPTTGEEDKELTERFRAEWFSKFLRESLNSDYYGYTLFQFPDSHENFKFDSNDIEIVPRWSVLPNVKVNGKRDGIVIPSPGAQSGVSFKTGRYSKRLLGIGEEDSFGMFASIAPLFIYKKNAMSFWSGYQQRYGEPTIAIKMATQNDATHKNYTKWLKSGRGTSSGIILRQEDEAMLLEANRHDAYNIYMQMMSYCDEGISKALEGNTLTSDAGGGKTKGDVHADVAKVFHLGRLKKLAYAVNDHLMPFLEENYDFDFNGKVFRWKEFKDVDAEVDNIMKLSTNWKMDADEVFKRTGYQVLEQLAEIDQRQANRKKSPDKDDNTAGKRD